MANGLQDANLSDKTAERVFGVFGKLEGSPSSLACKFSVDTMYPQSKQLLHLQEIQNVLIK